MEQSFLLGVVWREIMYNVSYIKKFPYMVSDYVYLWSDLHHSVNTYVRDVAVF